MICNRVVVSKHTFASKARVWAFSKTFDITTGECIISFDSESLTGEFQ
jgi:hypothetical protein